MILDHPQNLTSLKYFFSQKLEIILEMIPPNKINFNTEFVSAPTQYLQTILTNLNQTNKICFYSGQTKTYTWKIHITIQTIIHVYLRKRTIKPKLFFVSFEKTTDVLGIGDWVGVETNFIFKMIVFEGVAFINVVLTFQKFMGYWGFEHDLETLLANYFVIFIKIFSKNCYKLNNDNY